MVEGAGFTFFPDSREANFIGSASVGELSEVFSSQPDMTGRFAHELLRQGKKRELYEALSGCQDLPSLFLIALHDVVTSTAYMCSVEGVQPVEGRSYIQGVMEIMVRLTRNIPLEAELDVKTSKLIEKGTNRIMAESGIKVIKYRLATGGRSRNGNKLKALK